MTSAGTTSESLTATDSRTFDAPGSAHSLNSQVRMLLLECSSRDDLIVKVLKICAEQFGSSVGRVDLRVATSMRTKTDHHEKVPEAVAKRFDNELLSPMASEVLAGTDPQPRLKRFRIGNQVVSVVSVPVMDVAGDRMEGAITLLLGGQCRPELVLPRLDSVAAVISTVLAVLSDTVPRRTQQPKTDTASATADVQGSQVAAVAQASQFSSMREFAYSVVNSLCEQLNAEQVFFGVEKNLRIRVEAVSGLADFRNSNPGIRVAQQAMEECLDAQSPIVFQPTGPTSGSMSIHRGWSIDCNNACVCSIPLKQGDNVTGVMSIRRPSNRPFSSEEVVQLERTLTTYGAAVGLLRKATSSTGSLVLSSLNDTVKTTLGRGSLGRKLALGILAAASLWFAFGTVTYRPLCRTTVVASNLRHVASPFDGKLLAVNVTPGQAVRRGDLLLEFDTSDLQLQLNGLLRDIAAAQIEVREAISSDQVSMAALARSRMNVLKTQAAAIQKQIDDAKIFAPDDGTVVLSDLQQRVGQMFPRGGEVLQFASGGDWLLEIEIPDDIVHYIVPQQTGSFVAASLPGDRQPFRIKSVDGGAQVIENRNVFVARAVIGTHPNWMKSGMEGTARIDSVPRPVWWVALHRVVDWARSSYWI